MGDTSDYERSWAEYKQRQAEYEAWMERHGRIGAKVDLGAGVFFIAFGPVGLMTLWSTAGIPHGIGDLIAASLATGTMLLAIGIGVWLIMKRPSDLRGRGRRG